MATPDPYQNWSGAPKHWVHVPAQRNCSPGPDELHPAAGSQDDEDGRASRAEWTIAAVALAVAVAAFVLIGTGSAMPGHEAPLPQRTPDSVLH